MRSAKVLDAQTNTPTAKAAASVAVAKARANAAKSAKKTTKTKWAELTGAEKDEILCSLALAAGLIEEE